jgi:Fic-DOC domain mobile mystery protein B
MHFQFPEGATPLPDYSDLLLSWVQTMSDLNRVEAENISHAQRKYLRASLKDISFWFHYKEFQTIHRSMFGKVWAWAGKQRKSVTSIGVVPGLIPLQIAELCKEVTSWSTEPVELTFLEKSARIHHRLVYIHPFENGNGRFSRLVADRCLLSWKCSHPVWPDNLQYEGTARKLYIQTLKSADKGDYGPLICLMKDLGAANPNR